MNTLDKICDDKRAHITRNEHFIPMVVHEDRAKLLPPPLGFCDALHAHRSIKQPALIAEVKKASPSKGIIRADFDPVRIAGAYEQSGAACISVLTDQPYFKGADEDLESVKKSCHLPVLRKDFILSPYQIIESRALGADCILLIMAALDDATAATLYKKATELDMDVLVEVHDAEELERAMKLEPMMIGVNSRNLKTLEVNLQTAFELIQHIPRNVIRVAESGISTHAQLQSLFEAGYDAFLVGESLLSKADISGAVRKLLGKDTESV